MYASQCKRSADVKEGLGLKKEELAANLAVCVSISGL
jgi:hypothetical protein